MRWTMNLVATMPGPRFRHAFATAELFNSLTQFTSSNGVVV